MTSNKNIVFNIILDSEDSYAMFIKFMDSSKFGKIIYKIYTLRHLMNLENIRKIWGLLQKNDIPLEAISMNSKSKNV